MERNLRVNYEKFTNCLRIAIVPDELQDERIEDVKAYCLRYGFSNVMLFFNAEEYNLGHITKEEATAWIETIKKAKRILETAGISVSLNPWMEMGHLDRGRKCKPDQNFTTMVDMDGKECQMVACPYDAQWRKYYFDLLGWYLQEVNPDFLWIEDDFRLHNHPPLKYGGCFCKLHMQKYNEKLGTKYTREEFLKKAFAKGGLTPERKVLLDVNRETILDISKEIGEFVKGLGLKTRIGLMSSSARAHTFEARDWHALHENLSVGQEKVNRIHLPCYEECCGKVYGNEFNRTSMLIRTMIPEDTYVYPEMENGSFSTFTKDARFLQFILESSAPLLISGMTYDIYDFVGNGTVESFGYGQAVKNVSPYLQGIMDLKLKFSDLYGVRMPIDDRAAYNKVVRKDWTEFTRYNEYVACGYVSGLGINCKPTLEKDIQGETVFLVGDATFNFTDEQLIALFEKNFVVVDGECVLALQKRGLGRLICLKNAELFPTGYDTHAYEQAADGFIVEGKRNYRASCLEKAGDYVRAEYTREVKIYTNVYDSRREYFGLGGVATEHFAVFPFCITDLFYEQYNPLRRAFLYDVLKKAQKRFVQTGVCGVHAYTYAKDGDTVLMLVNTTVGSFNKIRFETDIPFDRAYAVDRTGKLVEAAFVKEGTSVCVDMPLEYLSTATLLLQ